MTSLVKDELSPVDFLARGIWNLSDVTPIERSPLMNEDLIKRFIEVRETLTPPVEIEKTALVIIDMQEYQVRKDWPCYRIADAAAPGILDYFVKQTAEVVEPNIKRLIDVFRDNDMKIIYTMFSSWNKDGSDLTRQLKVLNKAGQTNHGGAMFPHAEHPSSRIVESLKPGEEDIILIKNTSCAFTSTNFEQRLRNMGMERLFVVGVVTNMCVEGTARIANELGFDVTIVDDACAAWTSEIHKRALESFQLFFGNVMSTDQVIEAVGRAAG